MITAELREYENHIVSWLLTRYGLFDTRTRFMLLDIEEQFCRGADEPLCVQQGHSPPRMLSLRAFHRFFPGFRVLLTARCLKNNDWARLTIDKVMTKLESTVLGRCYDGKLEDQGSSSRPFAVIHKVPYQSSVATSIVLHSDAPVDPNIPGPHFVYQFKKGGMCILETLEGFLDGADLKQPKAEWLTSAIDKHFLKPVPVKVRQ